MNILIKNGTIVTEENCIKNDLLVVGDKIKDVKRQFSESEIPDGTRVIDAGGKYVLPGLIDAHTHYQLVSRGTVTADDFYNGSVLAAFGGVTTVVDFSDHIYGKELKEGAAARKREAEDSIAVDWALHQVVTGVSGSTYRELKELKESGVSVIKIFTTYKNAGYFIEKDQVLTLLEACRDLEIMVTIHAEDDPLIEGKERELVSEEYPPALLPVVRPAEAEYIAVMEYGRMAGRLDMPLYIVHLSSAMGLEAVRKLRKEGVKIYCETTPTYLHLTDELLSGEFPQRFVMTPPLRKAEDNKALWEAVSDGEIDIIATDHCTFTADQKMLSNDCRTIYPGVPGTEEMLPLVFTNGVKKGLFPVEKMVSLLSSEPARLFGLYPEKGSLIPGTDADIVIFDPVREYKISAVNMHTKAGYTPYEGMKVSGKILTTILRGSIIAEGDTFTGVKGMGKFLKEKTPGVYRN